MTLSINAMLTGCGAQYEWGRTNIAEIKIEREYRSPEMNNADRDSRFTDTLHFLNRNLVSDKFASTLAIRIGRYPKEPAIAIIDKDFNLENTSFTFESNTILKDISEIKKWKVTLQISNLRKAVTKAEVQVMECGKVEYYEGEITADFELRISLVEDESIFLERRGSFTFLLGEPICSYIGPYQ